jgi:hypothetical protein
MDLRSLSAQFGMVSRVLFLSRKQQAFVEFSTVEEAALMLATCQAQPIRLGTRSVPYFGIKEAMIVDIEALLQEFDCPVFKQTGNHNSCS